MLIKQDKKIYNSSHIFPDRPFVNNSLSYKAPQKYFTELWHYGIKGMHWGVITRGYDKEGSGKSTSRKLLRKKQYKNTQYDEAKKVKEAYDAYNSAFLKKHKIKQKPKKEKILDYDSLSKTKDQNVQDLMSLKMTLSAIKSSVALNRNYNHVQKILKQQAKKKKVGDLR